MKNQNNSKCRLCLGENEENSEMFELFYDENGVDKTMPSFQTNLYEKVENCCGVRIRNSQQMPSKICFKCFDITRIWYNFRQMVLNSQVYLESLCTDQKIPNDFGNDDTKYINYLFEDLQNIPGNVVVSNIQDDLNDDFINEDFNDKDIDNDMDMEIKYELVDYVEDMESDFEKVLEELTTDEIDEHYEIKNKSPKSLEEKRIIKKKIPAPKLKKKFRPPSPTSYLCTLCGNTYQNKSSFRHHMSIHSNVKPHECEICNKSFRQVSQLNYHMRRHTGEKPYQCSYCERRFVDHSEQLRHERIHTNTRPYKCKVCQKSFTYSATLKNHSKIHTGQKDFHCFVCNKSFALQHQMKAHLGTILHKQKESQYTVGDYEVI